MLPAPITQFFTTEATIAHVDDDSPARDEYGNVVPGATTSTVRCYMAQQSRTEIGLDNIERERWAVYFPGGTALDANDRVAVGANEYEVVGEPWPVVHPLTGDVDHLEATLERRR
jgi:hypothetical protein